MIGQETVNEFKTGGSHRVNPFRGIPIGGNNRAEEEETSVEFPDGKYIFSNRLFINNIGDGFPMKLPKDISFSEASEYIGNQFKESNNKVDLETEMEILTALRGAQEQERFKLGIGETNEFLGGGPVGQAQGRMDTSNQVFDTIGTVSAGVSMIPGVGTLVGGIGMGVSALGKLGTGIIGGAAVKNEAQTASDNAEALLTQETKSSPLSTKVFPLGGLLPYNDEGTQLPQDTTRQTTNAYTDSILKQQMLSPINDTITPINDTTAAPKITLPIRELANGGFGLFSNVNNTSLAETRTSTFGSPGSTLSEINTNTFSSDVKPMFNTVPDYGTKESGKDFLNQGFDQTDLKTGEKSGFMNQITDQIGTTGAIGEGVKAATGIASNIVGLANTTREAPVPRYDIAQERNPNKLYTDEIRRAIGRNTQTQTQALANRSAGNIGAFSSNVAAIGNAGSKALGQSFIQQQQINNQEELATDRFNFRQRAIQARSDRQADDLDAQNEGAFQNQRNAYRDAIFANVGSFGETLSTVGRGNKYMEELFKNAQLYGLTITPNAV